MTSRIRKTRASMGRGLRDYDNAVSPGAETVQNALLKLLGNEDPSFLLNNNTITRMAADPKMLALLKALPAAAAVGGVGSVIGSTGDVIAGEESFNRGADLLGMGVGAYGMHRGKVGGTTPAGRALSVMAGLGLGKLGSDATQAAVGGLF